MHLHGQKLSGILEKFSCNSSFFWLKCKKTAFLKINVFLSKMFYQIKMQVATNWSTPLKKHQTFQFFQTTDFSCNFQKSHFSKIFENHQ